MIYYCLSNEWNGSLFEVPPIGGTNCMIVWYSQWCITVNKFDVIPLNCLDISVSWSWILSTATSNPSVSTQSQQPKHSGAHWRHYNNCRWCERRFTHRSCSLW